MADTKETRSTLSPLPDPVATELLRFLELSTSQDYSGAAVQRRLAASISLRQPALAVAN